MSLGDDIQAETNLSKDFQILYWFKVVSGTVCGVVRMTVRTTGGSIHSLGSGLLIFFLLSCT